MSRLWWALRWKLAVLALVGCWFAGAELAAHVFGPQGTTASPPSVSSPVPGSTGALIEEHDCWTGAAPADVVMPGHVVVTQDGRLRYGGRHLVDLALDQVFAGVDHGLIVHAFCR